jgi:hypothetical protein
MDRREQKAPSPAEAAEAVRLQRIREDARRPHSVNLAETIALSHKLMRVADTARKS